MLRCWRELTTVKISHLSSEALQALDDAYIASIQPKKSLIKPSTPSTLPTQPQIPVKSAEEIILEDRHRRFIEMIKKNRLEALKSFWDKYSTDFTSSYLLGQAAQSGNEDILRWVLQDLKVDPTLPVKEMDQKIPYDLCVGRQARNVFRRMRNDHPDLHDWEVAHVPSGLTEEMEEKQDNKKNERRKGLRDKMRERERARIESEPQVEDQEIEEEKEQVDVKQVNGTGNGNLMKQKLGGRDVNGLGGMSEEMRMKVERERRARAAEERFKRLGTGS